MENTDNLKTRIKNLRKGVLKTFLLLFIPHIMICVLTTQVTTNPMHVINYQSVWFLTYFSISLLVYILAPKIITRLYEKARIKELGNGDGGAVKEPKVPEPEKKKEEPKTRNAIMEVVLINNSTDKEYTIKSVNDFGLNWKFINMELPTPLLQINQNLSIDERAWKAAGRFSGFSILSTVWKTFDIVPTETENTQDNQQ